MLVLILTGLCVATLIALGVMLLRDENDDSEARQPDRPDRHRATAGRPERKAMTTPAVHHTVSERRIADESRKMIEEIEHYLAERRSS